jgi:nitrite reductase/ring-hydroxylating ferredoxin subunit
MSQSEADLRPAPVPTGEPLCEIADIAPGHSRGFRIEGESVPVLAFLVRPLGARADEVYGYVNQCAHRSMPLEWVEDEFLDEARKVIVCATHGAIFRIKDGLCIEGPCPGKSLQALSLDVREGRVYVGTPPRYR